MCSSTWSTYAVLCEQLPVLRGTFGEFIEEPPDSGDV